jgi:hypothetical protein
VPGLPPELLAAVRAARGPDTGTGAADLAFTAAETGEVVAATVGPGTGNGAETGADEALLVAWNATAHWLRGEGDACRSLAVDAMDRARRSGDDPGPGRRPHRAGARRRTRR